MTRRFSLHPLPPPRRRLNSASLPFPLPQQPQSVPETQPPASPIVSPAPAPVSDTDSKTEEPEIPESGIENETESEEIVRPFNPEQVRASSRPILVQQILLRIQNGEIDLHPEFQRLDKAWDRRRKSRLVESLLLRIPIPVFYVAADRDDHWSVVDGVQRITAIHEFVRNNFRLTGLEYLRQFDGRFYRDLPRPMQRRISETQLGLHVIDYGTPPEVMFNIFTRINTGGKPLNTQEIRNALHGGPVREYLIRLAGSDAFLRATCHSINTRRMADRELVLRFLAFFMDPWEDYSGDLDEFLAKAMDKINEMPGPLRQQLDSDFTRAMSAARNIFGDRAFRRPFSDGQRRPPVNRALFDSWSVGLARRSAQELDALIANREDVVAESARLASEDHEFMVAISSSTGNVDRVQTRFQAVEDALTRSLP